MKPMKVTPIISPPLFPVYTLALVLPLILIPVESILPYPAIVEEVAKALIILGILRFAKREYQMNTALFTVFLFSVSENLLYLSNFVTTQTVDHFWMRFVLTTSIHLMNPVLVLPPGQINKWLIIPMTILAIIVHQVYNTHIGHLCIP